MEQDKNRLTDRDYWIHSYSDQMLERQGDSHSINLFIRKHVPPVTQKRCLELGSFPGPFLCTLGDLGYELNGVDFHPDNATRLPAWLKGQGYETGEFKVDDIFNIPKEEKYDLVCSFGLIEHFSNYKDVIEIHADLLKPGGILLITTPNMRLGMQRFFREILDKGNLKAHYLPSMKPAVWAEILKENGFTVKYKGYFGNFGFWVEDPKGKRGWRKMLLQFVFYVSVFFRRYIPFESPFYSCYCGIVAVKK